jgi:hypothetical protein
MSTESRDRKAFRSCLVALTLVLPGLAQAASPAGAAPIAVRPPAPATQPPAAPAAASEKPADTMTEVIVTAEKPTRKASVLIDWIRRLLGQYTFEGKVDLGGKGNPQERWTVTGSGTCVGFGVAPGVQCEINVRWPQIPGPNGQEIVSGVSDLTPAMILYAMEPDDLGIRYLQVNSKGLAEGATGYIIGDTATFKTPCVNAPPGCERIITITTESDSKVIDMRIDTELNAQLAARFNFRMRRVAEVQAPPPPKTPEPAAATAPKAPAAKKK